MGRRHGGSSPDAVGNPFVSWILPLTLVLFACVLVGAIHFVFVRWMARLSERSLVHEPVADERRSKPDAGLPPRW